MQTSTPSLISAPDAVVGQRHNTGSFKLVNKPGTPFAGGSVGKGLYGLVRKISPPTGLDPRTV